MTLLDAILTALNLLGRGIALIDATALTLGV
jgi:hypothetical protein